MGGREIEVKDGGKCIFFLLRERFIYVWDFFVLTKKKKKKIYE